MTNTTATDTVQLNRVYIRATPERVWEAITSPEWNGKYGYGAPAKYDLRPGGRYEAYATEEMKAYDPNLGDICVDGEVLEADPPRKLVQTWRMCMDQGTKEEGFTRLTWEIESSFDGVCKLTVTHELSGAPKLAELVSGALERTGAGGGWSFVLSDLKSLVETGAPLAG
ncbi:SRPBCC family protein [Amycolatopsis magusensis]|uniref:SRPBCC family protein n=1 Tax=Amycolatopsis magusensis TaxID=882444 RepID=UPI00378C5828